jgi:hypothetical protein
MNNCHAARTLVLHIVVEIKELSLKISAAHLSWAMYIYILRGKPIC